MNTITALVLLLAFTAAFALTGLLGPPVMRLCMRHGWVAIPGGRRVHAHPTPTIGGIAIYGGFVAALLLTFLLNSLPALSQLQRQPFELLRLALLLIGGTLIFLLMWLDDMRELAPAPKLAGSIVAALIAVGPFLWDQTMYQPDDQARGIILTAFNLPFVGTVHLYHINPWLAVAATIFWIVAMSNTMNLVDGLDGLAAGISLIAALTLALHAWNLQQFTIALLPLALAGACAGFLLFNFPPARMFMGDSGAYFLGYILALSAIIGGAKLATALLVLGVPILDVAWLIVSRTLSGRSPAHAGRDHLHLRLRDLGFSQRQIVIFYYTLSVSFGLLGVYGGDRSLKLLALGLLAVIVMAVIVYASRRARVNGEQQPLER